MAKDAAQLLRGASDNVGEVRTKTTLQDLVTEWDTRSEDLIREELNRLTPDIPLLSEEAAGLDRNPDSDAGPDPNPDRRPPATGTTRDSDYLWVVDPIDGTVNFAHGVPYFSVSIALELGGEPVVGVVVAPALGWELYGHLGGGAFMAERRLQVSRISELYQAVLATGFPYDRATSPTNNFAEWEHFQRCAGACRRFGAASLDLCMVARGWLDGYWERCLHAWDLSAGALLVREAGGKVTSIDGGQFVSATGNAVASNGAIHKEILDELAAVGGATRRPT